ncbi:MAG: transporter, partial [Gammaproteobacteria bacterium]
MTFCAKRTWHPFSLLIAAFVLLVLPGCSTLDTDERIASVNSDYRDFTGGDLRLAQRKPVDPAALYAELDRPLGQDAAVRIALMQSPGFQLLLNEYSQRNARALQAGRIANPTFTFERLRNGEELELGRLFSIGLVDLLTLPQRQRIAAQRKVAEEWRLAGDVVERITEIRKS